MDLDKCKEIRRLFEELVIPHLRKTRGDRFKDRQIFMEVFGDTPEMQDKFDKFLKDVSACPPEVIQWCQEQINPKVKKEGERTAEREVRNGTVRITRDSRIQRAYIAHGRRYVSIPEKQGSTARSRKIALRVP